MEKKEHFDIYQCITDKIVEELEKGVIPWNKPWGGVIDGATSYVSRKPYSLINQILLGDSAEYLSFRQVVKLGGKIKTGAKSKMVVFWKMIQCEVEEEDGSKKQKTFPTLRYYNVFSVNDCIGIEPHKVEEMKQTKPLEAGEKVINDYVTREKRLKFNVKKTNEAYYSPTFDEVVVPLIGQFEVAGEDYSTAFHELTHSTMSVDRCNRKADNEHAFFGSEDYSKEELVAELGSAMLCGKCGIDNRRTFLNSVAYIQSWLKVLKNDKRLIVSAAGKAERAVAYILKGEKPHF